MALSLSLLSRGSHDLLMKGSFLIGSSFFLALSDDFESLLQAP
ncbi:hypothetical protein SynBIOSU31_03284 [Synechococcus sp. BIOS-U3-1]|nr:hypothetical protein SynBIOSU31_03284 [Synechococcus sp. BIOS-U3-1]